MKNSHLFALNLVTCAVLTACSGGSTSTDTEAPTLIPDTTTPVEKVFTVLQGNDLNRLGHSLLSENPGGPGGSPNQSLRGADVLQAEAGVDSLLIGALGADVLVGNSGDDILIGGTEDFNSSVDGDERGADNRDRAFGNAGEDTFIWTPGDGSDYFDGGEGTDVLILGLLGEERDNNGLTDGAPFFNVSPPGTPGSQDFDGIFLNAQNQPRVNVSGSPGFCSVVDRSDEPETLEALRLDALVRFTLRGVANAFDAGSRTDDDGLRVTLNTDGVEFVVCAKREVLADGGLDNIEVLDLTTQPPSLAQISDLPEYVQQLLQ